jgi:hypothetical protein
MANVIEDAEIERVAERIARAREVPDEAAPQDGRKRSAD